MSETRVSGFKASRGVLMVMLAVVVRTGLAADGEGTTHFTPEGPIRVNSVGAWTVTFRVGPSGIRTVGGIEVQFDKGWFNRYSIIKAVQHEDPDKNHYVTER